MTKIKTFIFSVLLIGISLTLNAQLSEGGFPMEVPVLKLAGVSSKVITMPPFEIPLKKSVDADGFMKKSLTFAHSFEVELGLENAGEWYKVNNYRIWQLQINSDQAKSIGLVFSKYYLPEGARLFLFDPDKQVVMGAFTSRNNKPHKRMATFPLPGDMLFLQYEEPVDAPFKGELQLAEVNHDFIGITSKNNRWPRRLSGDCNVDVNCENVSETDKFQRTVIRLLVSNELGTATLLNNTHNDGTPYAISAFHVYKYKPENAEIALFDFNYESPFCTGIDGYDMQSISGSTAVASFDSLDFMLVELNEMPPASFRPYFSGWDASNTIAENCYTIHHPNGDTKKISHDEGRLDSMSYSKSFIRFGHWKVFDWESGTTEKGSSGAGLFSTQKRLVGTLSGGYASCDNLSYDAFARFDKMWDYHLDSTKHLKYWLDPIKSGKKVVDGFDPYEQELLNCQVTSNFSTYDELQLVDHQIDGFKIEEVAERFNQFEQVVLSGVSIGIKDFTKPSALSELTIRIYTGEERPGFAEKQYKFPMSGLTRNAMNYFNFGEDLTLHGTFYISVLLEHGGDSLFIFRSNYRGVTAYNTMHVKINDEWSGVENFSENGTGASLLMQATICSASLVQNNDTLDRQKNLMKLYPNPASRYVTIEFNNNASQHQIRFYDMTGKLLYEQSYSNRKYTEIDVSGFNPGIYLVSLESEGLTDVQKLMLIGY